MTDIWIISDTHFNHENILKFRGKDGDTVRDFRDVHEMNETMIDRWNAVVKDGDKVYHLGDVLMGNRDEGEKILSRLKGQKRLLVGNHDVVYGKGNVLHKFFKKIYMWRMMPEHGILMTHVPVHPSTLGESRFMKGDDGKNVKMVNVHGHIHQNKSPEGNYFCVCVEQPAIQYTPIHIEDLKKRVR